MENVNRGKCNNLGISCGKRGSLELKPVLMSPLGNKFISIYFLLKRLN